MTGFNPEEQNVLQQSLVLQLSKNTGNVPATSVQQIEDANERTLQRYVLHFNNCKVNIENN